MVDFEQVDEEDDQSMSEADTLSEGEDEDEGAWLEPSHGGGNLPAVVRRRLVPTVSWVEGERERAIPCG